MSNETTPLPFAPAGSVASTCLEQPEEAVPELFNGEPVAVAYPHEAVLPAPSGGQDRQYRYRIVEKPQGGQRVEAIFLAEAGVFLTEPHWRAVKRTETLEALGAVAR